MSRRSCRKHESKWDVKEGPETPDLPPWKPREDNRRHRDRRTGDGSYDVEMSPGLDDWRKQNATGGSPWLCRGGQTRESQGRRRSRSPKHGSRRECGNTGGEREGDPPPEIFSRSRNRREFVRHESKETQTIVYCVNFQRGMCDRGESCNYSHDIFVHEASDAVPEIRPPPPRHPSVVWSGVLGQPTVVTPPPPPPLPPPPPDPEVQQLARLTELSASLAQFFSGKQFTQLCAAAAAQPNSLTTVVSSSFQQYDPLRDSIEQSAVTSIPEGGDVVEASDDRGESDLDERGNPEEEEKKMKDSKAAMRPFKFALADFVKDLLKPSWKDGMIDREIHKMIVRKVVEKVTCSFQPSHVPHTEDKINHYLSFSKPKLSKLIGAYVEKHRKVGPTCVKTKGDELHT